MSQGSGFMAQGSWLMTRGPEKGSAGPPNRALVLSPLFSWPRAMRLVPWAMSLEPWTMSPEPWTEGRKKKEKKPLTFQRRLRDHQCRLLDHPGLVQGWSGARVRVGMLRGKGSWFLGLGFKISKITRLQFSCFLEDIEPISKIFKNILDGSSGLLGTSIFQNQFGSPKWKFNNNRENCFFICFSSPGVSKNKNSWLWGSGTRPKVPKSQ